MLGYLEIKSSIESENFLMASLEEKVGDLSTLGKTVLKCVGRMCFVSGRRRRLQTFILPMPLCPHNMGIPGYNIGKGHLRDEFLRLNTTRWIWKEGRRENTCNHLGNLATSE